MSIFVNGVNSKDLNDEQKKALDDARALKMRHIPKGTQNVIWVHGLNAINTSQSPATALKKLIAILGSDAEICCSKTGPEFRKNGGLGPIGVYLKGATSLMASMDCGSYVIDGKRYTSINEKYIVDDYENLNDDLGYTEAFVAPESIVGFWVSGKMYETYVTDFESGKAEAEYKRCFGEDWEDFYEFEYLEPRDGFIECIDMLKEMGIPMTLAY